MIDYKNTTMLPSGCRRHPVLGLYVSPEGHIYSGKTGKRRKEQKRKDGYTQISIKRSSFLCHRIVAEVFVENTEKKPKINHKNGIKNDNHPSNLEWCTQRENIIHARDKLGVVYTKSGEQNPNARFLESHKIILANMLSRGFSQKEISEIMGFSPCTIIRHKKDIIVSKK